MTFIYIDTCSYTKTVFLGVVIINIVVIYIIFSRFYIPRTHEEDSSQKERGHTDV